ncbi:MAG: hypothetical protein ACI3ZZ_05525 [Candidatus Aphodosoma sp.]
MKRINFYFLLCGLLLVSCTPQPVIPGIYFISEEETEITVNCYNGNTSEKQLVTMNITVSDEITIPEENTVIYVNNVNNLKEEIFRYDIQIQNGSPLYIMNFHPKINGIPYSNIDFELSASELYDTISSQCPILINKNIIRIEDNNIHDFREFVYGSDIDKENVNFYVDDSNR